jgi:hypothetical protein
MIKMFVTKAVISKGFEGADALRFSENAETPSVRFRIGVPVYDKRAEKERRFINIGVKAFGYLVERIKSMKLDAGMYVNILGRYDEDTWEDRTTHEEKSASVLIVDEIEYSANGGTGRHTGGAGGTGNGSIGPNDRGQTPPAPESNRPPDNFTGFEAFGGTNPYFPES